MSNVTYKARDIRNDGLLKIGKLRDREPSQERAYYDALKYLATAFEKSEKILKHSEKLYGLSDIEALEMAYDNMQAYAKRIIHGKRRPK